ncbi:MAG: glycerophosphodiester phosphodiesterase, partial [Clostridia bacterium]|nr:glycerophosphodiester phosphodiesterase [Clostridia bacterium]
KTQALNFVSSPNFIVYNIDDLKEGYAMECRKKNLPILGYTARTEEQLKKAKELCDGIIFEEIAVT